MRIFPLVLFYFLSQWALNAEGDCRRYLDLSCRTCGTSSNICEKINSALESCADGICREATCSLLANQFLVKSSLNNLSTLCLLEPQRLVEKQDRDREFTSTDHSQIMKSLQCLDSARNNLDQALKKSVDFELYILSYGTNLTPQLARKLRGSQSRLKMGYRNYRNAIDHISHTQFDHALRQCENSRDFAIQVKAIVKKRR